MTLYLSKNSTTSTTTALWPLYRSTCVRRHPQLRTGWLCWSEVLLPTCPYWRQLGHLDYGEDARVLLNGVTCTISVPSSLSKKLSIIIVVRSRLTKTKLPHHERSMSWSNLISLLLFLGPLLWHQVLIYRKNFFRTFSVAADVSQQLLGLVVIMQWHAHLLVSLHSKMTYNYVLIIFINFGLKPNFGFNFGLKPYLRGNISFKLGLKQS